MNLDYVKQWIDQDPDPETKLQLQRMLDAGEIAEIEQLFSSRLSFGTAGLRAELGPGPMRMNRLVVSQTAKGLANFLLKNRDSYLDKNGELSAVIGYDARKNSEVFAKDSAEILADAGIQVKLFDQQVPTPVVAFTGRRLNSSASIVVTASHNPPNDNGYKVYLGGANGNSQIVPPQDQEIASEIDQVEQINPSGRSDKYCLIGDDDIEQYLLRCSQLAGDQTDSELKIVYTAMHGVGWKLASRIFEIAGLKNIHPVEQQIDPDPTFPTVNFPNPEEPGAMDLALVKARELSADLIIANDPDADRLAIGVPSGGDFRMLSGNELGILLADFVSTKTQQGTLAASYVSSQQILKLAQNRGLKSELTPTGFKWISKVENLLFGFEEALGYCVDPSYTPDKDGLTAALFACLIAKELEKEGISFDQRLDQISGKTGYFQSGQISIRLQSMIEVEQLMNKLKSKSEIDFEGVGLSIQNLVELDPRLDMLEIKPDESSRALIRASGTEPKLKCYMESTGPDRASAKARLEDLERAMNKFLEQ